MAPAGRGLRYYLLVMLGMGVLAAALPARSILASDAPAELAHIDRQKPPFSLDDLNRQPVSLSDQRSGVVVVHFFATWCEPCRDELPALNRLVARSDRSQLRVVTISVAEVDVRVRNFVEKIPVNFPILLDRDRSVAKSWDVSISRRPRHIARCCRRPSFSTET